MPERPDRPPRTRSDEQLRRLDKDLAHLIGAVAEACYRYAHAGAPFGASERGFDIWIEYGGTTTN